MNKKLKKKLLIAVPALLIAAVLCVLLVHGIIQKRNAALEESYLQKDLASYSKIHIIAEDIRVDGKADTLAAFKEAARLGADSVTLDLCFRTDGTPVICRSFDEITKDTLQLAQILKLMQEPQYANVSLHLRLRQLVAPDVFNALLAKYKMTDRVYLSGIDKSRYGILTGDQTAADVFYDYAPADDPETAVEEIRSLCTQYGVDGVILENGDASDALIESLNEAGIPYILRGVDQKKAMYKAIDRGVFLIETKDPAQLSTIFENWKTATQKRIDASVLDELQNQ